MTNRPPRPARAPASTDASAAAPDVVHRADVTEVLPPAEAKPPAKLSKLSLAMQVVQGNIATIEGFDAQVAALVADNPKDRKYDLTTKAGRKACDDARAEARKKRLAINNMVKDGKRVLNDLKEELVAAAERHVPVLEAIEDNAKDQLDAAERAEEQRKQKHRDAIAAIRLLGDGCEGWSSETCAQKLQAMESVVVDQAYEEFEDEARNVRAGVVERITQAKSAAIQREHEERRRQEAEAARAAAQAKIDAMKALPDQCEGTEAASIRIVLDAHNKAAPTAADYGELLEMAELVHFRVAKQLEELWTQTGLSEETAAQEQSAVDLADSDDIGAMQAHDVQAGEQQPQVNGTPPADPDPFSEPLPTVTRTTHTVPAGAIGAPVRRALTPRVVVPPKMEEDMNKAFKDAVVGGTGEYTIDSGTVLSESEVPDLLEAAQAFITAVQSGPRGEAYLPDEYRAAYEALKAAVDFTTEFAD